MLIVCSAIWIVSHLSTRLLYNTRFFQLSHRFSIMSASNNIVFYFLNSSSSLDVYYTVDIWHKIQSTWEPKKRPSLPFLGHWPLASPPQEAQEKNKRLTGIRWPLQASPPWQVMTGRSVFWPPDWRGSWRRKNLNRAKILYPELLFARVPLQPRWFAWETDMWSEECSRREGTVFGDIFLRKFRLRPKKIVFGDNFFTDSACGDHKTFAWPPNTCRLLFPFLFLYLWIFASFQPMPWPVCPWSPLHDCLSTRYAPQYSCMRTSWAPKPPKHTLPV